MATPEQSPSLFFTSFYQPDNLRNADQFWDAIFEVIKFIGRCPEVERQPSYTKAENSTRCLGGSWDAIALVRSRRLKKVVGFAGGQGWGSFFPNILSCGTSTIGDKQVIICGGSAQRFFL